MADNKIATKEAGEALGQALANNSVLKELDISSNAWDDRYTSVKVDGPGFAKGIADGLSANGALTSLNLSKNALCGINEYGVGTYDASGVTALADAIGKHQ